MLLGMVPVFPESTAILVLAILERAIKGGIFLASQIAITLKIVISGNGYQAFILP